jgi:hypothetical protein
LINALIPADALANVDERDCIRSALDGMTQGQSVMLATNEIMAVEGPGGGCRWRNTP